MPQVDVVRPDGAEIRRLRKAAGVTAEVLARRIRRHPQTIWKIESGSTQRISVTMVRQIARTLGVKPAQIIRPDVEPGQDEDCPVLAGAQQAGAA